MADAYKVKADVSFPKALRKVDELIDGQEVYETTGVNYSAGGYLYETDLTPRDRERAANGELDHLLEGVSKEEADEALYLDEKGVFIPQHEAEAVVLMEYGHEVVPKDQVLELKAAGADAAREAFEGAVADGASDRPALTASEVPSLADVSRGEGENVPLETEPVDEEGLARPSSSERGLEQPPGLLVGEAREAAEASDAPKKRGRPARQEQVAAKVAADRKNQGKEQAAKLAEEKAESK